RLRPWLTSWRRTSTGWTEPPSAISPRPSARRCPVSAGRAIIGLRTVLCRRGACPALPVGGSGCVAHLIVLDRREPNGLPAFRLVVESEFVGGQENGVAVQVARYVAAMRLDEAGKFLFLRSRNPSADRKARHLEFYREAVFDLEPFLQHIELQCADDTDNGGRAILRLKELDHALLSHLLQCLLQLFRLHGVAKPHPAQDFRREVRYAAKQYVFALRQRVADAQRAVVGNSYHVSRKGLVCGDARAGEEELGRAEAHRLAGAHQLHLHPA